METRCIKEIGGENMARIVKLEGKEPKVITEDEAKFPIGICTCGLSTNFPFCNGSHERCGGEEEGSLYAYDGNSRVRVK
ncbi:iron-binding zinc finger CDGSH type [archaeon]|nr:iron-binding zinc finger CDGSH type [archaeon]